MSRPNTEDVDTYTEDVDDATDCRDGSCTRPNAEDVDNNDDAEGIDNTIE
ncbi:MAG: hypothetical protein LBG59_10100 [Candidatus Peribacteria bacterium]|nr:hypothetical protein [Candidatus Peribacteria bacterium]